ncbi:MAG: glycosyltransferase family 39 protein, partial [Bacteroidota bacterium]
MKTGNKKRAYIYGIILILLTIIVYSPSFTNGFIENWDDNLYVIGNPYFADKDAPEASGMLTEFYMGHYHPLTMLSLYLDHALFGMNPAGYHFMNLLLHIISALLVFIIIGKIAGSRFAGFIAALIFALHPLHVESVAWISERKDVLYGVLFLAAFWYYIRYRDSGKKQFWLLSGFLFILSVLSKSAAIVFPVAMLVYDYFCDGKLTWRRLIDKVPFLIISVIFGLLAFRSQEMPLTNAPEFSYFNRIFLAGYALSFYLFRFLFPFRLSAIHYYPEMENSSLPAIFYITPVVIIAIILFVYFMKNNRKVLVFGFLFFLANIMLVAQFVPMGEAYIAERYTYIPYIGLAFIIGVSADRAYSGRLGKGSGRTVMTVFLIVLIFGMSIITYKRVGLWKDGIELFSDVIEKYPDKPFGYFNRGLLLYEREKMHDSERDFSKAIELGLKHPKAFFSRGSAKLVLKDFDGAIEDNTVAISLDSSYAMAYYNRGLGYASISEYEKAVCDFLFVSELDSANANINFDIAGAYFGLKKFSEARDYYTRCINMGCSNPSVLYFRGLSC